MATYGIQVNSKRRLLSSHFLALSASSHASPMVSGAASSSSTAHASITALSLSEQHQTKGTIDGSVVPYSIR